MTSIFPTIIIIEKKDEYFYLRSSRNPDQHITTEDQTSSGPKNYNPELENSK